MRNKSFSGEYDFLSNFYKCNIEIDGLKFKNTESAFQSYKDLSRQNDFEILDARTAKFLGRQVDLRNDWDLVKDDIMYKVVKAKFQQNEELLERLKATGNMLLIEGNDWHDNYWGDCTCNKCKHIKGKNKPSNLSHT